MGTWPVHVTCRIISASACSWARLASSALASLSCSLFRASMRLSCSSAARLPRAYVREHVFQVCCKSNFLCMYLFMWRMDVLVCRMRMCSKEGMHAYKYGCEPLTCACMAGENKPAHTHTMERHTCSIRRRSYMDAHAMIHARTHMHTSTLPSQHFILLQFA